MHKQEAKDFQTKKTLMFYNFNFDVFLVDNTRRRAEKREAGRRRSGLFPAVSSEGRLEGRCTVSIEGRLGAPGTWHLANLPGIAYSTIIDDGER